MDETETAAHPRRALRGRTRFAAILLPLMLLLGACDVGSTISDTADTVGGWLGFTHNADTFSTPTFRVNEYVRVKLTIHVPSDLKGSSIKVGLLCNGGTELDQTITVNDLSPDGVTGTTEFTPASPLGIDCFINQELTNGIKVVQAVIGQANANGQLDAVLTSAN
jgi:hypothetical protein